MMMKYAKVVNDGTKQCDVGLGTNAKFYESIGMTLQDVEQGYDGRWYLKGYAPERPIEEVKAQALATIDNATSQAILAGFDYEVEGESLHFSYDSFDQQNFADTANVCSLSLGGVQGLPNSVTWNAYRNGSELVRLTFGVQEFLALYTGGALVHKSMQMEIGGQRKAQVEACETVDEINALLGDWGL